MSSSNTRISCRMSQKFYTGYRCSKCAKRNVFQHKVCVIGCAETNDPYVSAGTRLHLENLAEIQAKYRLQARVEAILQEQKNGVYRTAEYNYKCSRCGHKEPWSRLRFTTWKIIAPIVGLFGFIGVLFALSVGPILALAALAALAAVIGVPFIVHRILVHFRERKIAELPQDARPVLTLDPNEPTFRALFG